MGEWTKGYWAGLMIGAFGTALGYVFLMQIDSLIGAFTGGRR